MLHCSKMAPMNTQVLLPGTQAAAADRHEPSRSPVDDAVKVERFFLVTVGLMAGLEIGLLAAWLIT